MLADGISIVIPAYNEEKYLPSTLSAIQAARGKVSVEVIVVNNASTDRTAEVARSFGAIVVDFPGRNISAVRNAGIKRASHPLILTLDADCSLPEDGLQKICDFMSNEKMVGASLGLRLITNTFPKKILAGIAIFLAEHLSGINGAMFCFWKADALTFGGFREDHLIAEDRAFAKDLSALGAKTGRKFGILKSVRVETPDRKDICLRTLVPQLRVILRAVRGKKQSVSELGYWYSPKR